MRTCENCGIEFEGPPQARFHSDACRKAFARRKAEEALEDPTLPSRQLDEEPAIVTGIRSLSTLLALPSTASLTEEEEQVIREHFGYAGSENRSREERHDAAARMLKAPLPSVTEEQYVRQIRREAGQYADAIGETDAPYKLAEGVVIENRKRDRMARAEAYARWRYQGYLKGEVASL